MTSVVSSKLIDRSFIKLENGLKMAYSRKGEGSPLIFVPGLGRGAEMWRFQLDDLSSEFDVIAIDNRGSGESDKPAGPYSISMMAEDLSLFMDAMNISKAVIIGASMGGFIAQTFAVNYPEKVEKLVLIATSPGGPNSIPMEKETWEIMWKGCFQSPKEYLSSAVRLAFSPEYWKKNYTQIMKDIQVRLENMPPAHAWMSQAMAGANFNGWDDCSKISQDTLILSGRDDLVVAPQNSVFLNQLIPHSKLVFLPGGHYVMIESWKKLNHHLREFLGK
ncbi:MAG: alpha/beta hydrolase [Planctomycetota bacterium]|nr:MAG: alpha/beta hydrolase [Planctomycetota bacterium]